MIIALPEIFPSLLWTGAIGAWSIIVPGIAYQVILKIYRIFLSILKEQQRKARRPVPGEHWYSDFLGIVRISDVDEVFVNYVQFSGAYEDKRYRLVRLEDFLRSRPRPLTLEEKKEYVEYQKPLS